MEELSNVQLDPKDLAKTTRIGTMLPSKLKEAILEFLKDNLDVFAWSHKDMPRIDTRSDGTQVECRSNFKPIKQKRIALNTERYEAIKKEVDKLMKTGLIRLVLYPTWLAKVVLVKKSNEEWRVCVNFTDLNKVCPKDSFSLSKIDQLVDSTVGSEFLQFLQCLLSVQPY